MKNLSDYIAGADEEARVYWANECADAAVQTVMIAAGLVAL